ncbi:MAG: LemA family protein [Alphaproteobacteria bacterium]|nr:LemA family protein [Alphaproteobacteria bacterium]
MNALTIILIILAALALYVVMIYNRLVVGRNRTKEAYSDIETHLKRRYDLIPNLVETVKGYAKHERETLEKVVAARSAAMSQQGDAAQHADAENMLSKTLKSIFALSESYPDLKANENFRELQRELADTEDKIQASRRFYNSVVLAFNNKTQMFPSSIIAGMFRFTKVAYFELDEAEKAAVQKPVKVQF